MKNLICFTAIAVLVTACNKNNNEPYSYEQSTIYSQSDNANFSAVLLDIKPYILDNNVKKYLVNSTITNVTLKMDENDFGDHNSLSIDTSLITKQIVNNYVVTTEDVSYPVNIPFRTNDQPLTNAGEFSSLLNNRVILSPGFYHCKIASFEIKLANNTIKKISTNITKYIEVKQGMKNQYLGEFEILIK